ncbi:23S rRNA (uracil(1939)-C(5))-methyltransferase RlmD [Megalodesulfovibrio gigas]|uniref:Putative RNA methyltransferase, TrmA family n=1 Tax=Megalodesulfovibrio gigas (strain ATCC 19364 / DSM 1382 / NCIMB 9332 / VKM B-1759) TaxID=1121448 RepID=T2GB07_MEGG1|nr:23S rRNA (uracil(1939)-C(5))-methyltransferase RlmD [Megalodesulfovibrio gigas]AGW13364.1 putative RNA methyltransferase, TrmA family [Megalodesulfovibrio gigas DSM 1382 = ATCC 19364]
MHTGDIVELSIDSLELQGRGVARDAASGMVVFVERGLPGQRVKALTGTVKGRFAEAEAVAVLEPSPHQTTPACPHFGPCGGCTWQDLAYPEQLRWKSRLVQDSLARLGGETGKAAADLVAPCIASPLEYGYRNKMEFAFMPGDSRTPLHLGLRKRGSHEVLDVTACKLMHPEAMAVLEQVRAWTAQSGLPAWDEATRTGCWRFCTLRQADAGTDLPMQMFVQLITARHPEADLAVAELTRVLKARFLSVAAVVHHVRVSPVPLAQGEELRRHGGPLRLPMPLGDLVFHVSADGFFQTNTQGAVKLYETIREMACLTGTEKVLDLYCGSGGIALWLARHAAAVAGMDASAEAVRDAQKNATANKAVLGDVAPSFKAVNLRRGVEGAPFVPDVVVVDPPRGGMEPAVVDWLLKALPARIVAVSCNPATLARDLAKLGQAYAVTAVQPVDMFPHTPHVEVAVRLERLG